jgi:segregation and condensation protein B
LSGYRFQSLDALSPWLSKLWQENAPKYSRAMLETLALIAYRQPITRGEIEQVRGVAVSSNIIKTLTERDWVKVVGHKEVPGRPALYATTKGFLDYFSMTSLSDLPNADAFENMAESVASDSPLKVLNEAPSE